MNQFTASNGVSITIETTNAGTYLVGKKDREVPTRDVYADTHATGSVEGIAALREFFRAEEDERLGRWRVPGHSNWVCYPARHAYEVVVFNEDEPLYGSRLLSRGDDTWPYYRAAADAFFDAHPEPKPWHEAKPSEVWLLTVPEIGETAYVAGDFNFRAADHGMLITDPRITAGRRIWPEEES